jgi:hypothetical protein
LVHDSVPMVLSFLIWLIDCFVKQDFSIYEWIAIGDTDEKFQGGGGEGAFIWLQLLKEKNRGGPGIQVTGFFFYQE